MSDSFQLHSIPCAELFSPFCSGRNENRTVSASIHPNPVDITLFTPTRQQLHAQTNTKNRRSFFEHLSADGGKRPEFLKFIMPLFK
jgi:hypothetical protein